MEQRVKTRRMTRLAAETPEEPEVPYLLPVSSTFIAGVTAIVLIFINSRSFASLSHPIILLILTGLFLHGLR